MRCPKCQVMTPAETWTVEKLPPDSNGHVYVSHTCPLCGESFQTREEKPC